MYTASHGVDTVVKRNGQCVKYRVNGYNTEDQHEINTELEMLLLSYGDAIEIIEQSWLRVKFAEITKKMSDNYKV